jgi:hypothetical protein
MPFLTDTLNCGRVVKSVVEQANDRTLPRQGE